MLLITVTVTGRAGELVARYTMDHHDAVQRRALGDRCHDAFEAGQTVCTAPVAAGGRS